MMTESQLNYREYGNGTPVIILHGLLGMLDNWHAFARSIEEKFWIFLVDQRNHGKSFHSPDFDYKWLAADLENFMDERGLEQAHIIGHSMGGKTVLQFLNDHPARVLSPVCIDISPKGHTGGHEDIFNALLALDVTSVTERKEAFNFLLDKLGSPTIVHFLLKNLERRKEGGYAWKANISSLWDNYDNILAPVRQDNSYHEEILFVRGGRSDYIDSDAEQVIMEDFPNASIKTIADAGHWVHAEKPDELRKLILEFLRIS